MNQPELYNLIPHRPPFLWVDEVIRITDTEVDTVKWLSPDLDIFQGHYPNHPIMPGVLLCEAVFQSGAILMGSILRQRQAQGTDKGTGVPVLTRIKEAKFKREVRPGDTLAIRVTIDETIGSVWFLKGTVRVGDQTAVKVRFSCTMTQRSIS